ncbi:MAG: T9SS type A sorting domain-containing protein [Bacteroidia bacterium]|jgi:hypothetical protein
MKKFTQLLSGLFVLLTVAAQAQQLSAPNVEAVYGGRIIAITGYDKGGDTSRIFISTESANSMFYADVVTSPSSSTGASFGAFQVMPGLNSTAGYGGGLLSIAAHEASGYVYFNYGDKIMSSHPSSSTVNTVSSSGNHYFTIEGNTFLYFKQGGTGNTFNFGTLNSSGVYTASAGSPISSTIMGSPMIQVSPSNNKVYVFVPGSFSTAPQLYRSSDAYTALSASTTFTNISPTTLSTSVEWRGFGIGPDGRIFIGGSTGSAKYAAHTDNDTIWSEANTNMPGVAGSRFAFAGTGSNYYVYYAASYNNMRGDSGYWKNYGDPGGFETHPNDGDVYTDPNDSNVVYMTTDQGIGASTNRGSTIFEIDEGVEAVQVNDFDMTTDKNTAWIASKAGIRKVGQYQTSRNWTAAMFPNGDGSPYYSAEMSNNDTNTVYVGNLRIYKTTNGSTWSQVFSPESAPYNYGSFGARAEAIEVCDYDANTIFAGYYIDGPTKGGLYYSTDGGSNWNILRLKATSGYNDVDVWDIVFNKEGSDTVAYVGVDYDLASPTGRSVYRIVKSGSTWTPAQNMDSANTSTGTTWVITIRDLHKSMTGDTLFACGNDAGSNHPVAYYKPISATNKWTPYTTSGFPITAGKNGAAITLGVDTVYCAVDNDIYIFPTAGTAWSLGYSYPVGTQINFLYYDELLAGTGTGLYGHMGTGGGPTGLNQLWNDKNNSAFVYPNPSGLNAILAYRLDQASPVTIRIHDLQGREVFVKQASKDAGMHQLELPATVLKQGLYLIRISAGSETQVVKWVLEK